MKASDARTAHLARLHAQKVNPKMGKPSGNYDHAEHIWGVVAQINAPTTQAGPTVDVYLNGAQYKVANPFTPATLGSSNQITRAVKYLSSYQPTVGDVVLVQRGKARLRSSHVVLGKPYGSPSPYGSPLGYLTAGGVFQWSGNQFYGGPGSPSLNLGGLGDLYWSTDEERFYYNDGSGWIPIGGGGGGFYASLKGPGQVESPGGLNQSGYFTATTPAGDTVGFVFTDNGSGGFNVTTTAFVSISAALDVDLFSSSSVSMLAQYIAGISGAQVQLTSNLLPFELSQLGTVANLAINAGDPNGIVEAIEKGDVCIDVSTPALWQATASGDSSWVELGSGTGVTSFNGRTGAVTFLEADLAAAIAPGATGHVMTSTGTAWTSDAPASAAGDPTWEALAFG